ncbi:MAG: polyhydroxyalkanoate synthesis regulator DNA-binding domain-containing protein [Acidobacteriaceae bacterium]|jgi:polyhydroxyalkanoate synthesis repressor PhaR
MPPKAILIKKYENRRLYDATNSRYVNLEDVAEMLKKGHDVRVVDAASGKDITRLILTQIIIEDAKTPDSTFPLDLLRQMIITSGRASQETALRYMKTMLDIYQDSYRAMSPAVNPFGMFRGAGGEGGPNRSEPVQRASQGGEEAEPETEEVGELKRRVADLEKLVGSLAPGKPGPRKRTSRK